MGINNYKYFRESEIQKAAFLEYVKKYGLTGLDYEFSPKEQHERGDAGILVPRFDFELKASDKYVDSVSVNVRQIKLFRATNKFYVCSFSPAPGVFDLDGSMVIPSTIVGKHMDETENPREKQLIGKDRSYRALIYRDLPGAVPLPEFLEGLRLEALRTTEQEALSGSDGTPELRDLL